MNIALMVMYIVFAVAGSTLIKAGSTAGAKVLFTLPAISMNVSAATLFGILAYGASFVLYVVLLSRFDLSFISPLLVGFVYVLLMFTAFFLFKESFTVYKILGCSLILIGILLVLIKK